MFRIYSLQAYTITSLTSVYANSDKRLKENIKDPEIDFLKVIDSLKIKEFNLINDPNKKVNIGLIAQELRDALPEKYRENLIQIGEDSQGILSINEGKLPYITMGAVQQLSKENNKLKKENSKLKEEIKSLKKDIKAIKKALNLE